MMTTTRYAIVTSDLGKAPDVELVARYLPSNYEAVQAGAEVFIFGQDSHGWTLDGYVIPRLRSGLIVALEINHVSV